MLILLLIFLLFLCYIYYIKNFEYWEKRNVKHDKPIPLFGNNAKNFLMLKSVSEMAAETYLKYPNEKVVGFYRASSPELVIRDPAIIKRLLVSDFDHFYVRGLVSNKVALEPILRNIFFLDGDDWRLLRKRMTPAFASGKLKAMFPLIVERAERLQQHVLALPAATCPLDARDLMARYTTDFIGACGFGIDDNSITQDTTAFRELGKLIFNIGIKRFISGTLKRVMPYTFQYLKPYNEIQQRVTELVGEIMAQRNYESGNRCDFIDLLIETKKEGMMTGISMTKFKPDGTPDTVSMELDEQVIAAQVFIFFAAGFETSSSAMSHTMHQLAYHPEVQKKVHRELDAVLAKYDNKLSYDAIKEMTYLEWTLNEGIRMFPPLGYLMRVCTKKYTIPELDLTIDEGVRVIIPLQALQNDPEYFENPEKFIPERFDPSNFTSKQHFAHLPFGTGPRACIGMRMGMMQAMTGMAAILSKFSLEPAPNSTRAFEVRPLSGIVQSVKSGFPLCFKRRV